MSAFHAITPFPSSTMRVAYLFMVASVECPTLLLMLFAVECSQGPSDSLLATGRLTHYIPRVLLSGNASGSDLLCGPTHLV